MTADENEAGDKLPRIILGDGRPEANDGADDSATECHDEDDRCGDEPKRLLLALRAPC